MAEIRRKFEKLFLHFERIELVYIVISDKATSFSNTLITSHLGSNAIGLFPISFNPLRIL